MRVLTIQHQADAPAGMVGDWLLEFGAKLDVVRPDLGMPLPESLRGYAGLLVLGGAMGAYDDQDAPWLPAVKRLLATAVEASLPTLGICLGHQLLAVAAGGTVAARPAGRTMGTVGLRLTMDALLDPLFGALRRPYTAVRWHQDVVTEPPPASVVMAMADQEVHGFRVGEAAWGVQVHPEASAAIVRGWADRTEQRIRAEYPDEVESGSDLFRRLAEVQRGLKQVRGQDVLLPTVWQPFGYAFATRLAWAPRL